LTDKEEHDIAVEMARSTNEGKPVTWRSMEEMAVETMSNRPNGPVGSRTSVQKRKVAADATSNRPKGPEDRPFTRPGFKWRHAFMGRVGIKDLSTEDLGQSRGKKEDLEAEVVRRSWNQRQQLLMKKANKATRKADKAKRTKANKSFLPSFLLLSFLPSFLPSFLHSPLHSPLPSFLPSFLPS
jgi:hypothetical protein